MADMLDMFNRDPNNMNTHVQVCFTCTVFHTSSFYLNYSLSKFYLR